MKFFFIYILIIFFGLTLFLRMNFPTECKLKIDNKNCVEKDTIVEKDTTLFFDNLLPSAYSGTNLTTELAKEIIKKHLRAFDIIYQQDSGVSIPENATDEQISQILLFKIDTIYFIDLNKNQYKDAIVEYTVTPYMASSYCFYQTKALIIDSDNGYKLINESFIPETYSIDSVKTFNKTPYIYCKEYNCDQHQFIEKLCVQIKSK